MQIAAGNGSSSDAVLPELAGDWSNTAISAPVSQVVDQFAELSAEQTPLLVQSF